MYYVSQSDKLKINGFVFDGYFYDVTNRSGQKRYFKKCVLKIVKRINHFTPMIGRPWTLNRFIIVGTDQKYHVCYNFRVS